MSEIGKKAETILIGLADLKVTEEVPEMDRAETFAENISDIETTLVKLANLLIFDLNVNPNEVAHAMLMAAGRVIRGPSNLEEMDKEFLQHQSRHIAIFGFETMHLHENLKQIYQEVEEIMNKKDKLESQNVKPN